MNAAVLRVDNDKVCSYASEKGCSIYEKTLGKYVDKIHQNKNSEMKPNYVELVFLCRVS